MILHITMLIGAHNVEIQSVFNMERNIYCLFHLFNQYLLGTYKSAKPFDDHSYLDRLILSHAAYSLSLREKSLFIVCFIRVTMKFKLLRVHLEGASNGDSESV